MKLTNEHKEAIKRARARLANAGTSEGAKKGWETRRRGGALPAGDDPKETQAAKKTPAETPEKKEEPWPSWKPRTPGLREAIARVKPLGEQFGYHVNPNYEYATFPTQKQARQIIQAGSRISPFPGLSDPVRFENWKRKVGAYGVSFRQVRDITDADESAVHTAKKKSDKLLAQRDERRKKDARAEWTPEEKAAFDGHIRRWRQALARHQAMYGKKSWLS